MPKNRFGGKNAKKMANKKTNVEGTVSSRTLPIPESEDQYFAKVTKRCGDGRFTVEYLDDRGRICEGMARVPGSMRRITRNVRDGSIIIFQSWNISQNDNKGSILHHYSDQEVVVLMQSGAIGSLVNEKQNLLDTMDPESEEEAVTVEQGMKDELDFDDI